MASQKSVIIENAQKFAAGGKVDKAIAEWKKLLAETSQDGNIYNNISDLYLRLNDKASAIDACLKSAGVYREAGFELKGVAVLKKILKIDPNRIDIYEMLADIDADRGLNGNAVEGYQQTAKIYIKNGNFRGAIGVYQKLVRFAPEDPEIPRAVARLYQKQEKYREAVLSYEQAMAIYESKQMVSEVHQIVEEIIKIDPTYLKQLAAKKAAVESIAKMGVERDITLAPPSKARIESPVFFGEEVEDTGMPIGTYPIAAYPGEGEAYFVEERELFKDLIPDDLPLPSLSSPLQKPDDENVLAVPPPVVRKPSFEETNVGAGGAPRPVEEPHKVSDDVLYAHLSEADAYLKYGLNENAIEKLLLVKELAPMREEAYLRLKEVYLKTGEKDKAAMAGFSLADIYEKNGAFDKKEILLGELHKIDPLGEYRKIAEEKNDASRLPAAPVEFSPVLNIAAGDLSLESIRETDIGTFSEGIDLQGMRALGATRAPVIDESLEESFDLASALTKELDDLSANALAIPHGGSEPIPSSSGEGVQNEKKQQYLETCYHLGIAQKEMGNYTKAIREFEQALAGAGRFQEVLSMLASCYAEQGDLAHAAAVLQEGLNDSRCQGDARLAILYDLASIHEQLGEKEKSFPLYKEIYRVNPKFRDVSGKVKEIPYRKPSPGSPESIRAKEAALFASEEAGVKDKAMAPIVKQKRRVSYV